MALLLRLTKHYCYSQDLNSNDIAVVSGGCSHVAKSVYNLHHGHLYLNFCNSHFVKMGVSQWNKLGRWQCNQGYNQLHQSRDPGLEENLIKKLLQPWWICYRDCGKMWRFTTTGKLYIQHVLITHNFSKLMFQISQI